MFPTDICRAPMAAIVPRRVRRYPRARAKFRFGSTWNCVKPSAVSLSLHGPRCGGEDQVGQKQPRKATIERGEWRGGYAVPAAGKNRPSRYAGIPATGWRIDRTIGAVTAKAPNLPENEEAARFRIKFREPVRECPVRRRPLYERWKECVRDYLGRVPSAAAFQRDATRCYHPPR